jgi:tetratricopeptide (TPR) repeat protein
MVYQNRGQYEEAEKHFQEALSRIDRMTEREKFRTYVVYYLINRNFQQAISEATKLIEKYPADATGFSNLALAYFYARNFDKAKEMGQRAVELKPREIQPRFNLSWYALAASDFEVAAQQAQSMIEENPDFYEVYVVLALANFAREDIDEAARIYGELAKINPIGESLATLGLADIALYEGRLADAVRILQERLDLDRTADQTYFMANKWSLMARAKLMSGNNSQAVAADDQALASGKDLATMFVSATTYIQAGQESKARALIEDLSGRLEPEPKVYAKLLEGEIHRKNGRTAEAVSLFQEAQAILDTWIGRSLLGKALIDIQAWPDAHSALDSCLTNRGEAASVFFDDTPTFHYVAQIYYYIGRAQEGLGSPAAADSYRKFLSIKEKADTEDPLVKDAQARLTSLTKR